MACRCPHVLAWLRRRGMRHAAEMHADPGRDWTRRDYRRHFHEEEVALFPVARPLFPSVVAELRDHHDVFEHELREYGCVVSTDLFAYHSDLEDELVKRLIERGL